MPAQDNHEIKDFNVDFSQIKFATKQQPSDLIFIGSDFFDDQQCYLKGLPSRESSWFALIDLRSHCSSLDVIFSVLKSARLINGTLLKGVLFYVDEIPGAPSLNGLGNRSELHSAPLYAFLLPRDAAPLSVRRCSDTSDTTTACTVAISASPEGSSPRSRLWIHRAPATPSPPPLSPSFPRHRIHVSSPDHYSNQSSTDSAVGSNSGKGGSSGSGGVINVEDAFLNRSSVLFVAVSFILLMFISLAWLVFYYVQRFRYLHSKERASRRLAELARKAVARIPLKLLQAGDKEIGVNGEHCAICIEPYRPFDNIRILPCRQDAAFGDEPGFAKKLSKLNAILDCCLSPNNLPLGRIGVDGLSRSDRPLLSHLRWAHLMQEMGSQRHMLDIRIESEINNRHYLEWSEKNAELSHGRGKVEERRGVHAAFPSDGWSVVDSLTLHQPMVQTPPPATMMMDDGHYFHKLCIDPWLLEQRSCPMCKLDILQAYDFRPEIDRSCPASTGSDSSTPPAVASVGPTSSPALASAGMEEEGLIAVTNSACDEVTPETVITASVSTSYHDLERQSQMSPPNRRDWLRSLFRPPAATPSHQRRNRRLCLRNLETVVVGAEYHQSHPRACLPAERCDEESQHATSTTVS
ncbi:unnamed protein product [Hydatigera taeniaeformis]|uniref:RING-type domain-containing protein n=1 Tax=Hydatigena taeniaeformis TaxID=6205 RepID=A0A158RER1_HYDTA|nr:unnamed protein product [Hydatigera taeniaeformis]